MFHRIALALHSALYLSKARDLSARGDGRKAMRALDAIYDDLFARGAWTIECNLLRSQIAVQVENGPLALASAEAALNQLERGDDSYKAADRAYLVEFARAMIHYGETWRYGRTAPSSVNVSLVQTAAVSARLRRDFPFPPDGSFI